MVHARDGDWAQSEKSFRRAIEIDPSDSTAYSDLSMVLLLPLGRIEVGVGVGQCEVIYFING
jgi:Flp pilus assembly protein TadD